MVDLAKFLTQERHAVHLIGVAGSGMSGIAGLLLQLGHQVSGSDKLDSLENRPAATTRLKFYQQHRAADARDRRTRHLFFGDQKGQSDSEEAPGKRKEELCARAEALAAIMSAKRGILVVGMHGKTHDVRNDRARLTRRQLHPVALCRRRDPDSRDKTHTGMRAGDFFRGRRRRKSDGTIALFHPEHALVLKYRGRTSRLLCRSRRDREGLCPTDRTNERQNLLLRRRSPRGRICLPAVASAEAGRSSRRGISYGLSENADYRGTDINLRDFTISLLRLSARRKTRRCCFECSG